MPSMQLTRSVWQALVIQAIDCSSECAITGSKAFSCSWPASAAAVTVASAPITLNATWLTTSGITGLTLPGMIDEPGLAGGQEDLAEARLRARRQQPQVVADLRELDRGALQRAGQRHEDAGVGGGLDQVGRGLLRDAGDVLEVLAHRLGVARVGGDAGADRGGAHVDLVEPLDRPR